MSDSVTEKIQQQFESGPRDLVGLPLWVVRIASAVILVLAVNQAFNFGFFLGYTLIDLRFY